MGFFGHVFHAIGNAAHAVGHFVASNWTTIATTALSTVVFVGVMGLTGGLALPLALVLAGAASGATGYLAGQLLTGQPIRPRDLLVQTGLAVVTTLLTAGAARAFPASALGRAAAPVIERVEASAAGPIVRTATETGVGAALGVAGQVATNAAEGHKLTQGLGSAALGGAIGGLVTPPLQHLIPERGTSSEGGDDAGSRAGASDRTTTDARTARIDRALDAAPPDVLQVIDAVLATPGGQAHASDFFDGAHVVIEDRGALYDTARALPGAVERLSSHASQGPQYQVAGDSTGPILFGKTADGSGTWVQLEGHRADLTLAGAKDLVPHMVDYVKYKLTGRNQSRFGSSGYTEARPLILEPTATGEPTSPGIVGALAALGGP